MLSDSLNRVSRGTYCTPADRFEIQVPVALVVEDPHAEGLAAEGHPASDPPQTDDPVRLAAELDVGPDQVEPLLPPAPLDRPVAPDDVLGEREQQRHGKLGHGIGRHLGDVGDEDAALRGGLHIHDVHPHALPGDVLQPGGRLDETPGDAGFDADQEHIRIPKLLQEDRLRVVIQNGYPGDLPQQGKGLFPGLKPRCHNDFHHTSHRDAPEETPIARSGPVSYCPNLNRRSRVVDQDPAPIRLIRHPPAEKVEELDGSHLVREGKVRIVAAPDQPLRRRLDQRLHHRTRIGKSGGRRHPVETGQLHPAAPLAMAQQVEQLLEPPLVDAVARQEHAHVGQHEIRP